MYVSAYVCTYTHAYPTILFNTYICTQRTAYTQTYKKHTHKHMYIHTNIQTYAQTYIRTHTKHFAMKKKKICACTYQII